MLRKLPKMHFIILNLVIGIPVLFTVVMKMMMVSTSQSNFRL